MVKSLSNPTQDQGETPSASVFQGKISQLSHQISSGLVSHRRTHRASPVKSSFIKLYESVWSREAVKWLRLSASSSSHKCLCLDLCFLKGGSLSFVWIPRYVGGELTLDSCDLQSVYSWSLIGAARAGLRCNNGKPTFQKALRFSW